MTTLKHESHEHPLRLNEENDVNTEVICKGCGKPISGDEAAFRCEQLQCGFFLHKACAELPLEIEKHPMHPQHRLTLRYSSPYRGVASCDACLQSWDGFLYRCDLCDFDVDILCAFKEKTPVQHPSHVHPLYFLPRKATFECMACRLEKKDSPYVCVVCDYWLHKSCAEMPTTVHRTQQHPHPLHVIYSAAALSTEYRLNCAVCPFNVGRSHWCYCCFGCQYIIHVKCLKSDSDPTSEDEDEASVRANSNVLRLPLNIKSDYGKLIESLIADDKEIISIKHHDHPIGLLKVEEDTNDLKLKDEDRPTCNACTVPISGECYGCPPCNFFIHKSCAYLPLELQHQSHEHPLSIRLSGNNPLSTTDCKLCRLSGTGYFYRCDECDFAIDVKCASLPYTILHEAHKHPLTHYEGSDGCMGCGTFDSGFRFNCDTCKAFSLHYRCALLPRTTKHRFDKHPLSLAYTPIENHPEYYMCDLCEVVFHPQFWFYSCAKRKYRCRLNTFKPECLPHLGRYASYKFGGIFKIEEHPHPIRYFRGRYKITCNECGVRKDWIAFIECTELCGFLLCRPCMLGHDYKCYPIDLRNDQ